jgi:hypothetical protein
MSVTIALGVRSLREAVRHPDALFMTMFIPIFFLVVNTGQAAEILPSESTEFLEGQGYGAFQLPITLLLAASFGMAALFLVEEIEGGYFDKLRAMPIRATRWCWAGSSRRQPRASSSPRWSSSSPSILTDLDWGTILPGFAVVGGLGVIMLLLNVRMIQTHD